MIEKIYVFFNAVSDRPITAPVYLKTFCFGLETIYCFSFLEIVLWALM
jgi:hypothetical protein